MSGCSEGDHCKFTGDHGGQEIVAGTWFGGPREPRFQKRCNNLDFPAENSAINVWNFCRSTWIYWPNSGIALMGL